jgi:hypothetical protein
MSYTNHIQETIILEKIKEVVKATSCFIGDNDDAVDWSNKKPEEMVYNNCLFDNKGYTISFHVDLSYYWSTGSTTPITQNLIENCFKDTAVYWTETYPNRPSYEDCLDDESEYANEAQQWEVETLGDTNIWLRVEGTLKDNDIIFSCSYTDEICSPYGKEFRETFSLEDFLLLSSNELETFVEKLGQSYLDN